jgi:hypothetical protein
LSLIERFARHDAVARGAAVARTWTDGAHPADVSQIASDFSAQLGQRVPILRCLKTELQPDGDTVHRWWQIELPGATEDFEPIDGREWQRPGWSASAEEWIRGQVAARKIEQIRCWEFSYVARVRGAGTRTWYFKALPCSYAHEPPLTRLLADVRPELLPRIVAVEPGRRWMLSEGCRGRVLEEVASRAAWEKAVAAYAELQLAMIPRVAELRAVGCRQIGEPAFGLPLTLEHGDFWPSNVIGSRVIDWTDAAIAHPFFSLVPMRVAWGFRRRRVSFDRLRDAYLEPWTALHPPTALREAFELAQPLALRYFKDRIDSLPPHDQWWLSRLW